MRIISIVGARPQFIKLAPLSEKLSACHQELIIHTGQHYDYTMSERIFSDLGLRNPDFHLGIGSGSHALQTGEMMKALEEIMVIEKPALVVIFGDTNSTLAGALAASKLNIPLVHVEAGLRSYNKSMPEEINRVVADHVSEYLFAPTDSAADILKGEGLADRTFMTGDIMVDTISNNLSRALEKFSAPAGLDIVNLDYNLLTLHRNYNVDNTTMLTGILRQLDELGETIIFPVHPRTLKMLENLDFRLRNIVLTEPLGYLDFIAVEHFSKRIITDSGGVQKEAYILKKPCITLRTETEWTETVTEKWNLLVDPSDAAICEKILSFVTPETQQNVFGRDVSTKMVDIINKILLQTG
jgi:UDP-N-acetylglucosamine 2-epimerase